MIIINKTGDEAQGYIITGSYNGKQFGVSFDEQKYQEMLNLQAKANNATSMEELKAIMDEFAPLTQESYKDVVESKTPYLVVNKHTNKFYLQYGGKVSSQPLPQVFVDRILKAVDKNLPIEPLIKCWARYMRPVKGRPAYNQSNAKLFAEYIAAPFTNRDLKNELLEKGLAEKVATDRATTPQVSITQEGLLVGYKVSREIRTRYDLNENEEVVQKSRYKKKVDPDTGLVSYDEPTYAEERLFEPWVMGKRGDEFFSGEDKGHFIRVGRPHFLEKWEQVGNPGCKGLHCGGLNYISGFQNGEDAITHNIFIDPMDIYGIAGLGTGNDGAMTVKRYFVYGTFNGVNKTLYHSSEYAKLTDAEYATLVQEAVEANEMSKNELDSLLEEAKALSSVTAETKNGSTPTSVGEAFKG